MAENKVSPPSMQFGFVRMMRTPELTEVLKFAPKAFILACIIATRCRWRDGFNALGLTQGEAFLGDWEEYGLTEKEYRTAKKNLKEWKFAEFRRASIGKRRGTVARLLDKRLFDTSAPQDTEAEGGARANGGRSEGEKRIKEKNEKNEKKRHRLSVQSQAPEQRCQFSETRIPANAEKVFEFGERQGCDYNLCARFIRYNNKTKWSIHGRPIYSWEASLLKFRDTCEDSPGEVGAVPQDWIPEIVFPDN